jgi:hypothetical protein
MGWSLYTLFVSACRSAEPDNRHATQGAKQMQWFSACVVALMYGKEFLVFPIFVK